MPPWIWMFSAAQWKYASEMYAFASAVAAVGVKELAEAASIAKAYCSDAYFHCASENIQIHGGIGLTLDLPLAKWFVDQRSRMITEGASEVMRMVIAREVLKKYN